MSATARLLLHAVTLFPEKIAFELPDCSLSYAELHERATRFASALRARGVLPGDRVAMFGETTWQGLVALLGCHLAGGVWVAVNHRYRADELAHILEDSGAKILLCSDDPAQRNIVHDDLTWPATLQEVLSVEQDIPHMVEAESPSGDHPLPHDDDLALLIYTSGTTGRSKGVELTFRAVVDNILSLTAAWQFSSADRLVLMLPLFHVHGLCIGVYGTLLHGMTTLLFPRFDTDEVIRCFRDAEASVFMGVPTLYTRLLARLKDEPAAANALRGGRLFTAGSAALPAEDLTAFEGLTGHRILERYGMSETLLTLSNPYTGERRAGSVGLPVAGCEIIVVDERGDEVPAGVAGEFWVRGAGLMRGYWRNPEATQAAFHDGWFRTGDIGHRSEDGYFTIVGRNSTDILKCGGFKISAREIEDALRAHTQVEELAVFGVPDREWGQKIVVALVPRHNAMQGREGWLIDMQGIAAAKLADYKKPRDVLVLDALPRNAMGKIQKHHLVSRYAETRVD